MNSICSFVKSQCAPWFFHSTPAARHLGELHEIPWIFSMGFQSSQHLETTWFSRFPQVSKHEKNGRCNPWHPEYPEYFQPFLGSQWFQCPPRNLLGPTSCAQVTCTFPTSALVWSERQPVIATTSPTARPMFSFPLSGLTMETSGWKIQHIHDMCGEVVKNHNEKTGEKNLGEKKNHPWHVDTAWKIPPKSQLHRLHPLWNTWVETMSIWVFKGWTVFKGKHQQEIEAFAL